mmetsp:Transcript_57804/g.65960  ORF Transcript_57804/g.65960 Transcript_57804/m.65960 type:complete len:280 (-) Transcript_57804:411-1250(-)
MKKSLISTLRRACTASSQQSGAISSLFTRGFDHMPKHKMWKPADYHMAHPVYDSKEIEDVYYIHYEPKTFAQKWSYYFCMTCRKLFDIVTRYKVGHMTEGKWLNRFIFLETVAGIPGMVAAMVRHLKSLRTMEHDNGWIHTLLEEAENERMHLFTFLELKKPSMIFKASVVMSQGIVWNLYFMTYLISPSTAHSFVCYLEEEAVKTYTYALKDLDEGRCEAWKTLPASAHSIQYWALKEDATFRDVLLAIRADEAIHRDVNHEFANTNPTGPNPLKDLN